MSNFWQRALTGTFFVLTIVLCTVLNEWSFYILLFAVNFLCLREFYQLMPEGMYRMKRNLFRSEEDNRLVLPQSVCLPEAQVFYRLPRSGN